MSDSASAWLGAARRRLGTRLAAARGGDEGAISLMVAGLSVALILLCGLVVDGGGRMREAQRVDTLAAEAARAGGQAVDVGTVISTGQTVVNPDDARRAANDYLDAAGLSAASRTITISPDQRTITVTVTKSYSPVFSGSLGLRTDVTGSAHASLIHGVTTPQG